MPDYEFDSSFGNDMSPETLECITYDDCYSPPPMSHIDYGAHYNDGPMWHNAPRKRKKAESKRVRQTPKPAAKKNRPSGR